MARVAINGLGRIGRAAMKIILDTHEFELVAINDLVSPENLAYLLYYDTVYGKYKEHVSFGEDHISVGNKAFKVFGEKDPANLPWNELKVDIVFECTGMFTRKEDLEKHLEAGAKHVILSAPSKSEEVLTIVHGVNEPEKAAPQIISCASCTTNCITPVIEIIGRRIGIKKAMMTTIHAYTASQGIVDGANKKMRRGRAAAANFVPTSTGAAKATARALPQYKNKFDGVAVRGPVPAGSIADLTILTEHPVTVYDVNNILREESRTKRYKDILAVTDEELVSSDIIGNPAASIVDLSMTQIVDGDLLKIMSWYDNEFGYASQLIREGKRLANYIS